MKVFSVCILLISIYETEEKKNSFEVIPNTSDEKTNTSQENMNTSNGRNNTFPVETFRVNFWITITDDTAVFTTEMENDTSSEAYMDMSTKLAKAVIEGFNTKYAGANVNAVLLSKGSVIAEMRVEATTENGNMTAEELIDTINEAAITGKIEDLNINPNKTIATGVTSTKIIADNTTIETYPPPEDKTNSSEKNTKTPKKTTSDKNKNTAEEKRNNSKKNTNTSKELQGKNNTLPVEMFMVNCLIVISDDTAVFTKEMENNQSEAYIKKSAELAIAVATAVKLKFLDTILEPMRIWKGSVQAEFSAQILTENENTTAVDITNAVNDASASGEIANLNINPQKTTVSNFSVTSTKIIADNTIIESYSPSGVLSQINKIYEEPSWFEQFLKYITGIGYGQI